MKFEDLVDFFRHYRHDLLNELQLLHGYASMGKIDKLNEKLQDIIEKKSEERKLSMLMSPHFGFWVLQFNSLYNQFRLSYKVNVEKVDLSSVDLKLLATAKEIMKSLQQYVIKDRLYNVELYIFKDEIPKLGFEISGTINDANNLKQELEAKELVHNVEFTESTCQITLTLGN